MTDGLGRLGENILRYNEHCAQGVSLIDDDECASQENANPSSGPTEMPGSPIMTLYPDEADSAPFVE
jgi:hypothetical protein